MNPGWGLSYWELSGPMKTPTSLRSKGKINIYTRLRYTLCTSIEMSSYFHYAALLKRVKRLLWLWSFCFLHHRLVFEKWIIYFFNLANWGLQNKEVISVYLGAVYVVPVFTLNKTFLLWFNFYFYMTTVYCRRWNHNLLKRQPSFRLCELAKQKVCESGDYANANANASTSQYIPL